MEEIVKQAIAALQIDVPVMYWQVEGNRIRLFLYGGEVKKLATDLRSGSLATDSGSGLLATDLGSGLSGLARPTAARKKKALANDFGNGE